MSNYPSTVIFNPAIPESDRALIHFSKKLDRALKFRYFPDDPYYMYTSPIVRKQAIAAKKPLLQYWTENVRNYMRDQVGGIVFHSFYRQLFSHADPENFGSWEFDYSKIHFAVGDNPPSQNLELITEVAFKVVEYVEFCYEKAGLFPLFREYDFFSNYYSHMKTLFERIGGVRQLYPHAKLYAMHAYVAMRKKPDVNRQIVALQSSMNGDAITNELTKYQQSGEVWNNIEKAFGKFKTHCEVKLSSLVKSMQTFFKYVTYLSVILDDKSQKTLIRMAVKAMEQAIADQDEEFDDLAAIRRIVCQLRIDGAEIVDNYTSTDLFNIIRDTD